MSMHSVHGGASLKRDEMPRALKAASHSPRAPALSAAGHRAVVLATSDPGRVGPHALSSVLACPCTARGGHTPVLCPQLDTECDFGYERSWRDNGTCVPMTGFNLNTCPHVRDHSYQISKSGLRLLGGDVYAPRAVPLSACLLTARGGPAAGRQRASTQLDTCCDGGRQVPNHQEWASAAGKQDVSWHSVQRLQAHSCQQTWAAGRLTEYSFAMYVFANMTRSPLPNQQSAELCVASILTPPATLSWALAHHDTEVHWCSHASDCHWGPSIVLTSPVASHAIAERLPSGAGWLLYRPAGSSKVLSHTLLQT